MDGIRNCRGMELPRKPEVIHGVGKSCTDGVGIRRRLSLGLLNIQIDCEKTGNRGAHETVATGVADPPI